MKVNIMKLVKNNYFWLVVFALINLFIAFYFVRYPLQLNGDSSSYLNAMKFIQGQTYDINSYKSPTEAEIIMKARILTTPLMLYSSILSGNIFGSEYTGMLFVNIIFYFLIIFVFYELVLAVYKSKKVALVASILFFTNYGLINYGVTYRTDIGGWFFFLLATLLAVKYFKNPSARKFFYGSILVSSIGVLFKEYGALGLIPLGILILFLPINIGQKIKRILTVGILFLIIPISYYLWFYFQFHFSYIDWYGMAMTVTVKSADTAINWNILLLIKVLGWLFLAGWPIFLYGLYQEYQDRNIQRLKILLALLPASMAFLVWPGLTQRIAFIFVPLLAMISAYGLSKLKNKYIIILILIIYAIINYLIRNTSLSWDLLKIINF